MKKLLLSLVMVFCCLNSALADNSFAVPEKLKPRVNFWVNIFTKYGEHNEVLHHRAYPQAVFMVLDFYAASRKMSANDLAKYKKKQTERYVNQIKAAMQRLADGKAPSSQLEQNIARSMAFLGVGTAKYQDVLDNDLIRSQTGVKEKYKEALMRSGRYLPYIENIFVHEAHLPVEITRLPFIESSFNYSVKSSVGAAGIWQFMPQTARAHKMMVNSFIDERLDVVEATRAAAAYMKHAYNVLGSWPLAITSYNHGVAGVAKKVKILGTNDISEVVEHRTQRLLGFASNNFYPEFLAALQVYEKKYQYFPGLKVEQPLSFVEYRLPHPASIGYIASSLGVTVASLKPLNYALSNAVWNGRYKLPKGYNLKVPTNAARRVGKLAKAEPSSPVASSIYGGVVYTVRRGDTLLGIAKKYSTSVAKLKQLNGLKDNTVRIGQKLKVTQSETEEPVVVKRTTIAKHTATVSSTYKVKAGDTLYSIARAHKTDVATLKKLNGMSSNSIKAGQTLKVAGSAQVVAKTGTARRSYTVVKGDTLGKIAMKFKVKVSAIQSLNGIKGSNIRIGQKLRIP